MSRESPKIVGMKIYGLDISGNRFSSHADSLMHRVIHLPMALSSIALLLMSACNPLAFIGATPPPSTQINELEHHLTDPANNSKSLRIISQPSQMTFINGADGPDGLGFRIIEKFAQQYGYQLDIITAKNEALLLQALTQGHADMAMLGEPTSSQIKQQYRQSQAYMEVTTQLIYRHGKGKPKSFESLSNKRIIVQDLAHFREKYAFLSKHYSNLNWQFSNEGPEALLAKVENGDIDYTLLSSHIYIQYRSLYPHTRVAFDAYYPEPIGLSLANSVSETLLEQLDDFFERADNDGTFNSLTERYLGHSDHVNPLGSMTFFRRVNNRLPNYADLIKQTAQKYNMDWRLLAAISYQESHWDPHATSPTGVRGMMMLTQRTAKGMGIENRLDVIQSLQGGAKYYKSLYRRLPKSIQEPDRSWFALASYNVGLGHIFDAREITDFQGNNPDRWSDVKAYLPLLEKKQWYQYTRYGFARGNEPVNYVQNIRHFHYLLLWRFPNKKSQSSNEDSQISIKPLNEAIKETTIKQAKIALPKAD